MQGELPIVPGFDPQGGAPVGAPPAPAQPQQHAAPTQGSPGKPHQDPEKQEQRNIRHAERNRVDALLPPQAKEGHFAVFALRGPAGRHHVNSARPVLQVLYSDVEAAGGDSVNHIMDALEDKELTNGRFLVQVRDKNSKRILDIPEFEIGSYEEGEDEADAQSSGYTPAPFGPHTAPFAPQMGDIAGYPQNPPVQPPGYGYQQPIAPEEEEFDQAGFIETSREMIRDEYEKNTQTNNDMVSVITTMMTSQNQAQQQMQMQMQQLQMQSEERRRESEDRRRDEQDRRDERDRRERADAKTSQVTLIATLAPLAIPLLEKMMNGKPDVVMPMLMKMLDGNQNTEAMKQLMEMQADGAKSTMAMYADANKSVQESQAKATGHLMTSFMETSTMVTKAALEAAKDDSDDPLDKFTRIAAMAAPLLKSMSNQAPVTVMPPADPAQIPHQQQAPAPAQPDALSAVQDVVPVEAVTHTQENTPKKQPTKEELVGGVMKAVHDLHTGALGPEHREPMVKWATDEMKNRIPDLYKGVIDNDTEVIYALGGNVLQSDLEYSDILLEWITNGGDVFLTDFLNEVRDNEMAGQVVDSADLTQDEIDEVNTGVLRAPLPESEEQPAPEPANEEEETVSPDIELEPELETDDAAANETSKKNKKQKAIKK